VKDIQAKITELLTDRKGIESLLSFEKARRGAPKDSMVFIGMANIAQYSWCAMQSLFRSRAAVP